ncbi:uncharacterized protein LOC129221317 [Uloborus diversus]|uniref:uncharacterized protein LOC129221317 n=1 Tax=Uloborus diversus TaxID=327109 RepID=UPI00240A58D4|nr:uncharacterized protein LOC129221317 [Uloborus diversus]
MGAVWFFLPFAQGCVFREIVIWATNKCLTYFQGFSPPHTVYLQTEHVSDLLFATSEPLCIVCNKRFSSKAKLKRHVEEKHVANRKRYNCDVCLKDFSRQE